MACLDLNNSRSTKLLFSRIYQQFLKPQMEYGLSITPLTKTLVTKKLEQAYNDSIRRFYGAHSLSSTVIMRRLARIPSMQACVDLLRFKYLHRIATLPADSLLSIIIAYKSLDDPPPTQRFLNAHLDTLHTTASRQSTLLQQCRPKRGIDPILHVPMDGHHRSRLIRWRLGWLTLCLDGKCEQIYASPSSNAGSSLKTRDNHMNGTSKTLIHILWHVVGDWQNLAMLLKTTKHSVRLVVLD
ncbi:hypothetical protein [Absidia glauca]|uniref:Uncharacterized protein n=1 Tax=Absidia glauca TaxID=4829 RepID=A0A168MQ00_ABSGL|nr:hypothetical protein [Absidia glauca]